MSITIQVGTYGECEIPFNNPPSIHGIQNDIVYPRVLTCETLSECDSFKELENKIEGKENLNTGHVIGLELSINEEDNTKFNIGAGVYVINDILTNNVTIIEYDGVQEVAPEYLTESNATFIGLDINKEIMQKSSPFTNKERRSICMIGAAIHSNKTNINIVNEIKAPILGSVNQLHDTISAIGTINLEGNVYGPNCVNLKLNKSAGRTLS